MAKGKLIVIDGVDGSGKTTQFQLLLEKLQETEYCVHTKDFPQYGQKSAGAVEQYLNGAYGTSEEVGPYRASILFAVDRYDASFEMNKWINEGCVVLCNRYVTANMGHQGGKIKDVNKRRRFFDWLIELEYEIFKIPKPDINIFLHVPPEIAMKLIENKGYREYIGNKGKDMLESDMQHQLDTEKMYLHLAKILPNTHLITCAPNGKLLSPTEIHEKIWSIVKRELRV